MSTRTNRPIQPTKAVWVSPAELRASYRRLLEGDTAQAFLALLDYSLERTGAPGRARHAAGRSPDAKTPPS